VLVLLVPPASDPVNAWLDASITDPRWSSLLATLILFAVPSTLLGTISPYAIRLEAKSVSGMGSTAGALYALSTAGSIIGTFATSFVLIPLMGTRAILYMLAAVLFILAVMGYTSKLERRLVFGVVAGLCLLFLVVYAAAVDAPTAGKGQENLYYETDTLYHHLIVQDKKGIRYMKFDDTLQSAMYLDRKDQSPFMYVQQLALGLLFEHNPERALLIGLGGGSLPKVLLDEYPELVFDVAEIDPAVVEAAHEYFYLPESPGLHVHVADGRDYLERTDNRYNMVFLDAYYADSIPFHLTTQEFLVEVKQKLEPRGVVVANVIGAIEGHRSELFRAMYKTFRAVFPEIYVFGALEPDGSVVDPSSLQNIILVATADPYRLDSSDLTQLPAGVDDGVSWIRADQLRKLAEAQYREHIPVGDVPLLTDDYAPLDSLMNVYHGPAPE
jgi:spermidine synthase